MDGMNWKNFVGRVQGYWIILCLMLLFAAGPASAQEPSPPFWFDVIPTHESGQITYRLNFFSRVKWPMPDLSIKLPLPEGTRFLEGKAQPGVAVNFDGREVEFFTSGFNGSLDGGFSLEITDPNLTVFTTQPRITWQGPQPGDYSTGAISFDVTRPTLEWSAPSPSRLQLGISTTITEDKITYALYPKAVGRQRMWDVRINVPLPAGVEFLEVGAPPTFTTNFDGREVSFFTLELPRDVEIEPLIFRVSTAGLTNPLVVTHAWASWKNSGTAVGVTVPAQEETATNITITQPHLPQQVIVDQTGDVPLPNYDMTSIAFQENGATLTIMFNLAGDIGPIGQPMQYILFIDSDCNSATGMLRQYRGAEYRISYNLATGRTMLTSWDAAVNDWHWDQAAQLEGAVDNKSVNFSIPYHLIGYRKQFCWIAQARNQSDTYNSDLPSDWLPNEEFVALTQYEVGSVTANPINGKLAIPLNNPQGFYDVSIFNLPDGQEIVRIPNARQPSFRPDGQRILTNHESKSVENLYEQNLADGRAVVYVVKNYDANENIYEYDFAAGLEKPVSLGVLDSFPFYNPAGDRIMYTNSVLAGDKPGAQYPRIFVQCSSFSAQQEGEQRCQELGGFSLLVGETGVVLGSHPVWADTDKIAYQSCSAEDRAKSCGIYLINAPVPPGLSDGVVPVQLTQHPTDLPSDAKLKMIAFTSQRSGDWEAYMVNEDGSNLRNLSNSPVSNDGLPAISPDGQWAAFVSDREGSWAVWAAPAAGGSPQKLFDLPTDTPWGNQDRAWTNERISWGP